MPVERPAKRMQNIVAYLPMLQDVPRVDRIALFPQALIQFNVSYSSDTLHSGLHSLVETSQIGRV